MTDIMSKLNFDLNCDKQEALSFIESTDKEGIVKNNISEDCVEFYLTSKEQGFNVVEYVYRAQVSDGKIKGQFSRPERSQSGTPTVLKTILTAIIVTIVLAAFFTGIFTSIMIIARSPIFSLSIAIPSFTAFGAIGIVLAYNVSNRKRHIDNLKKYFAKIRIN